jgi:hypothetical protein
VRCRRQPATLAAPVHGSNDVQPFPWNTCERSKMTARRSSSSWNFNQKLAHLGPPCTKRPGIQEQLKDVSADASTGEALASEPILSLFTVSSPRAYILQYFKRTCQPVPQKAALCDFRIRGTWPLLGLGVLQYFV